MDGDPRCRHFVPARRDADNLPRMRPDHTEAGHDLIPVRDLVLDRVMHVAEGLLGHQEGLFAALQAWCQAREWWGVMINVIGGNELVEGSNIELVNLVEKAADERLVLFCGHGISSFWLPIRPGSSVHEQAGAVITCQTCSCRPQLLTSGTGARHPTAARARTVAALSCAVIDLLRHAA